MTRRTRSDRTTMGPTSGRTPVLLVVLALGLAAALAWVLIGGEGETPAQVATNALQDGSQAEDPLADPAELAVPDPPSEGSTQLAASAGDEPTRRAEAEASLESWEKIGQTLSGRVLLPPSAPPDETLEVFALAHGFSHSGLHDDDGLFSAGTGVLGPKSEEQVWSRSEVGSDGSFQVGFPADADTVHLALRGRYLYLPHTVEARADENVALEPEIGGRVLGRVRAASADGVGLAGTPVRLAPDELSTLLGSGRGIGDMSRAREILFERFTHTDADGRFELQAVPAGEGLKLIARPDSLAFGEATGITVEAGRETEVAVTVSPGATLAGRVVDPTGAPVAEVEIRAHRSIATFGVRVPGDILRETESGSDGRFELAGVMPGTVRLGAKADGFLDYGGDDLELGEGARIGDLVLELDPGAAIVGDVFLPDGSPAKGARIRVEREIKDMMSAGFRGFSGREGATNADAEGHFEIAALSEASFKLHASWTEERDEGEDLEYIRILAGQRAGGPALRIDLDPPVRVTGRVIDEAGEPITEFRLDARKRSDMPFLPMAEREREEFDSEDGTFEWTELYAGIWTIEATAEGYSASESVELELPSTEEQVFEFVLPRSARVAGVVLSPDGTPAEGAEVSLDLDMMGNLMRTLGQSEVPEATTAEDGSFLIEIPPGDQALVATHAEWADSSALGVSAASSEDVEGVQLVLRRGALVTGEVYDKEGELASAVQVILQRPTGAGQRFAQSDRDGFFTFEHVTPGDWQLVAMVGDKMELGEEGFDMGDLMSSMQLAFLSLEDGGEKHVQLGAPPENPVVVQGVVRAAGEPVPEVLISFFAAEGGDGMEGLAMTQADEEGRFELQLDEPGKYVLNVQKLINLTGQQQSVEFREEIPAAEEHSLTIDMPGGAIRGRIYDADGAPAPNVRVSLTSSDGFAYGSIFGGQYADVRSDDEGHYELVFLREGTYAVGAGGATFGGAFGDDSTTGRQIESGIRVQDGKSVDGIDFHLAGAGRVEGIVRDAGGKPVGEAAIFLRDAEGSLLELFSMVTSDASGKFTYSGVAPGEYTVSAQSKDRVAQAPVSIEVKPGETSRANVTIGEGTVVLVSLVDKTEANVEANVRVKGPDGLEWSGMMSMSRLMEMMGRGFESEEQKVGPLPPGEYEIRAIATDGREAKKKVNLTGQAERKVRLRLRD